MNIMVYDIAAQNGGALSVLNEFYNEYKDNINNNYTFIISTPNLEERKNIKVLKYPWIKKSWFHRIYFDYFIAHKLVKKYNIDKVISLQNVIVPCCKISQTIYVHNSLPFSQYKFPLLQNKLLWTYQNIISKIIFKSISKADNVIVQSNWMKNECIRNLKVDGQKIEVMLPKINIEVKKQFESTKENLSTFFYPASGEEFKNHRIIVRACEKLNTDGINNYKVIFTLNGNENKNISSLYKKIINKNLPIEFIGPISRAEVFEYYSNSTLIFPSYIETIGLPLIEGKMHECPILVSDCEYSREILNDYNKVYFFNPFSVYEVEEKMKKIMSTNTMYD